MCKSKALLKRSSLLILTAQACAFMFCAPILGENAELSQGQPDWISADSGHFTIYYHSAANLDNIERELNRRTFYFDEVPGYDGATTRQKICDRLDRLLNKAKELLDMYPDIPRIKIKIFEDRAELNDEYLRIFDRRENLESFYIYKHNTIYTSENDISDSIIIHEMAHAVIDHYFAVIPPEKVAEILAAYVDVHFEE
jgi:hypothetical protein